MENIKNEVLGTPVSKEVSAWHGAHEGVQSPQSSPPRGLGLRAAEEGDSNPARSRAIDWMKFPEGWFAISSPLMQPCNKGFSTVWRRGVPATKVLLLGRWFKN